MSRAASTIEYEWDESETQLESDYWSEARLPLPSLVFLIPLLVIYECGVLWVGGGNSEALRNGADFWMRGWLHQLGLGHLMLLPGLVVFGLMAWHYCGRYPWRFSVDTLIGMLAESLLFAFLLIVLGQLQDFVFQNWIGPETLSINVEAVAARTISFIGAGIYEEVMFRLCLLPICYGFFRMTQISVRWSAMLAIISTSLAFSLAHYVGPAPDTFAFYSFSFRALAGTFFAALFWLRGFGITVGCHAAYDLLVGILIEVQG